MIEKSFSGASIIIKIFLNFMNSFTINNLLKRCNSKLNSEDSTKVSKWIKVIYLTKGTKWILIFLKTILLVLFDTKQSVANRKRSETLLQIGEQD